MELSNEEFSALEEELNKHKVYGHRGLGGLSGFDRKLAAVLPNAEVLTGLAVRGNDCQNKQDSVHQSVNVWLDGLGFQSEQ